MRRPALEAIMRLVFGGFLIVSGLAMAAVGLDRSHTSVSHTDPPPSKPKSATSGEPVNAPASTIVTLPARARAPEELVMTFTANAPVAGADVVSELQRELARVACYDGPVNGHWSAQKIGRASC